MRSARWKGIRTISLDEVDDPRPGPADVVLDVQACGICGSDVHAYAEGAWITEGAPMGHEFAGTASEVGAEVAGIAVGDRVAVIPMGPCGTCPQCSVGHVNLCADLSNSARGGLSDRVLVPRAALGRQLYRMPDSLAFEEGAFLEPLSVATRAIRSAAPDLQGPILVTGLGSIGQCVLRVLQAYGATDVLGVDVSPPRLAVAAATGAAVLDARSEDLRQHVLDRWGTTVSPYQRGGNVGTVFECSGALSVLDVLPELTAPAGTISIAGLTSETPRLDLNTVAQKELRLLGSFAYTPPDSAEAFRLLAEGEVQVAPLVSHRVPLSRVDEAFEAQHAVDGSVKVVVVAG
ncbi:zinc-dependent alcohol dehydrogenase [Geodermatophilus sabuli]|uniref:(R,R)-butanediol dehydrogenase / meso-butanediol dehydrogenase / diacetyl reductase n=1 Tax=Geodermatophilus sabuli TaxID=1564158 RepID=A0A285E6F6_9ACTN|nr:alcohol dehydrogenase catalytic domain-containing protein [Geodermatophilus sabuli]MBB3082431.1 threonine dehydrogenase-like Zn-dependent dehydrogenase [Geodermatophilus sabuli]SNX94699.1 (R,R)-butanediol dehydrogenase / meso-butanediol dehydrogenase / diacetyl reductase [Geodermatophilus sabuli]